MVRGGTEALICIPPPLPPSPRDLPTFFTWESPSPFQMLPPMGLLEPGQACRVKVTFQPPMAVIYEAQATCWYGEGSKQKSSIQLQAVGEARPLTHPQSPPLHLPGKQSLQCAPPTPALDLSGQPLLRTDDAFQKGPTLEREVCETHPERWLLCRLSTSLRKEPNV